jgi:hypothetical protein
VAETVVFSSRRTARVQRMQGARHVLVGLTLALTGWEAIADGHHASWIDYLALVAGALLLVAFVREMRALRGVPATHEPHAAHGINWVDVFAGVVTFIEAAHLSHRGKVGLPLAYAGLGLLLLALGLFHTRVAARRRLIVDEVGFDIRRNPFSRIRGEWADMSAIMADDTSITLTAFNGAVTRIDLADVPERARVIDVFTRYGEVGLAPATDGPEAPAASPAS